MSVWGSCVLLHLPRSPPTTCWSIFGNHLRHRQALSTIANASRPASIALPCPSLLTCSCFPRSHLGSYHKYLCRQYLPCMTPSVTSCCFHHASVLCNLPATQSGKLAAGPEAWRKVHRINPTPCRGRRLLLLDDSLLLTNLFLLLTFINKHLP